MATEEQNSAAEPVADPVAEPVAPENSDSKKHNRIVIQTSLVLLSHPAIRGIIEKIASNLSKGFKGAATGILLQILGGASGELGVVWKPGDPQQVEGVDKLELASYTLDFAEPIRIKEFHDALNGTQYNYSFMHYRRPGDPIGRDYIKIQDMEDSAARAEAAAAASAPAGKVAPLRGKEAAKALEEKFAASDGTEPGVDTLKEGSLIVNVLDSNQDVIRAKLQTNVETKEIYGDFPLVNSDGQYKLYRAHGRTVEEVIKLIQTFIENPDI